MTSKPYNPSDIVDGGKVQRDSGTDSVENLNQRHEPSQQQQHNVGRFPHLTKYESITQNAKGWTDSPGSSYLLSGLGSWSESSGTEDTTSYNIEPYVLRVGSGNCPGSPQGMPYQDNNLDTLAVEARKISDAVEESVQKRIANLVPIERFFIENESSLSWRLNGASRAESTARKADPRGEKCPMIPSLDCSEGGFDERSSGR